MRAALAIALMLAASLARADAEGPKPGNLDADVSLGYDAIQVRDFDTAIGHLTTAVRSEPNNADAHNLLGFAYRNVKKYDLAFKHYEIALKLDPAHKGAHEYIGEAYLLVGDKAKAQEHLAALLRICGRNCEEYQDLARALAQAK
jgi:Flp pilus assembly protein TadD